MQVIFQRLQDIRRKNGKPDKFFQYLPVNSLPFFPMRLHPVTILYKSHQMSQFMDQGNQERPVIQVPIDTDAVVLLPGSMPVISQHALPLPCYSQMHLVMVEIFQYQWSSCCRNPTT